MDQLGLSREGGGDEGPICTAVFERRGLFESVVVDFTPRLRGVEQLVAPESGTIAFVGAIPSLDVVIVASSTSGRYERGVSSPDARVYIRVDSEGVPKDLGQDEVAAHLEREPEGPTWPLRPPTSDEDADFEDADFGDADFGDADFEDASSTDECSSGFEDASTTDDSYDLDGAEASELSLDEGGPDFGDASSSSPHESQDASGDESSHSSSSSAEGGRARVAPCESPDGIASGGALVELVVLGDGGAPAAAPTLLGVPAPCL